MRSWSAADWSWPFAVALLTLAASSIPYLVGYKAQTPERTFVGAVFDVQDYHSHLAKMQLGARGELAYRSLFTAEEQQGSPIILFYNLLGAAAGALGVSLPAMYQAARWVGGLAMFAAAYDFLSICVPLRSTRRLAFGLSIVSSGLGWAFLKSPAFSFPHQSPIDFWLIDAYTLFSILVFPHFGFSIAALIVGLTAWWRWMETRRPRWLVTLTLASLALGFVQIFELPLLNVAIGLDFLRRVLRNRSAWKAGLAAVPGLALTQTLLVWPYLNAILTDPLMRAWSGQHPAASPKPVYYLVGYGLAWPLIGLGLWKMWKARDERLGFAAVWLAAVAALVYFPTSVQYRYLEGVQFPMSSLAAAGLGQVIGPAVERWGSRLRWRRAAWWVAALVVLATMPSTLYLVAGSSMLAGTGWRDFFLTRAEVETIGFIGANADESDVTLAAYRLSNAIPARTATRVYYGHWAETIFVDKKRAAVAAFYSDMPDSGRRALLRDAQIRFVVHSPEERKLGTFDPAAAPYLTLRFRLEDVEVYEAVSP